jgi:DNA invertase Pin-like site-specific DNA recombinase
VTFAIRRKPLEVKSFVDVRRLGPAPNGLPAAEYIRKSTDHQKYSTENQSDANRNYAARRGMQVVCTYVDEGISGLTFDKRDALQHLIKDVQSGAAAFKAILIYDVSRWGRPQDPDEAAYYEFICKRAGIAVHYCAEQFENDGTLVSTVVKNLKRAMAGEYSRELSVKVFAGQERLVRMGFRVSGSPGYGLRRLLLDENGIPKHELQKGQWKSIATDRVILVPGPKEEVEIVRLIFSMFVEKRMHAARIAAHLNGSGMGNGFGRGWTTAIVLRILRNEKYIGNSIWNCESFKLQQMRVRNSRDKWIRVDGAFEAIVDKSLFDAAQAIFLERSQPRSSRLRKYSERELLDRLRQLLQEQGDLSRRIIRESEITPEPELYDVRFGSLSKAYKLIGFVANRNGYGPLIKDRGLRGPRRGGYRDEDLLESLRRFWREQGYITQELLKKTKGFPSPNAYVLHFGSLSRAYRLIGYVPDPARVRALRAERGRKLSNEALLDMLRDLLRTHGRISSTIIDAAKGVPCSTTIENRFGGLRKAYELIGYTPERNETRYGRPKNLSDAELLVALRSFLAKHGRITQALLSKSNDTPSSIVYSRRFGSLSKAYQLIGYMPKNGLKGIGGPRREMDPSNSG